MDLPVFPSPPFPTAGGPGSRCRARTRLQTSASHDGKFKTCKDESRSMRAKTRAASFRSDDRDGRPTSFHIPFLRVSLEVGYKSFFITLVSRPSPRIYACLGSTCCETGKK